jgi:hypothetical protein
VRMTRYIYCMNSMTNLTAEQKAKVLAVAEETIQVLLSIAEDDVSENGLSPEESEFFYKAIADGFNDTTEE